MSADINGDNRCWEIKDQGDSIFVSSPEGGGLGDFESIEAFQQFLVGYFGATNIVLVKEY